MVKLIKLLKKGLLAATGDLRTRTHPCSSDGDSNPSDFEFMPTPTSSPARYINTRLRSTNKVIQLCGAENQEDIQSIRRLQMQESSADSTDSSFEDDAQKNKQDLAFPTLAAGQHSSVHPDCKMMDFPELRGRKSDFTDHSYESTSMSPASPWCRSPQHTPISSPRREPHPLPAPRQPLRCRAGAALPKPLPLPPREAAYHCWQSETRRSPLPSPPASPLRPLSPRFSSPPQNSSHLLSPPQLSPKGCPRSWAKVQELGRGSYATVYEGLNPDDGSYFAVKVIYDSSNSEATEQEVAVLSKLDHPNIVRYLGASLDDKGDFCIFLELMKNSLKSVLGKLGRGFEENTIRQYVRQILHGLVYLHDHNTIHRDIKCGNILVNADGLVKLADFGVAKQTPTQKASSLKGTPLYMAPEMINPGSAERFYGFPVDIWSLGCTVLEMADGKPPWNDMPGFAFYFKLSKGQPPPIPAHLSPTAKDFIRQCLRFKPEDRPTARKLLQHPFITEHMSPLASPRATPRHPALDRSKQQQQQQQGIVNSFSLLQSEISSRSIQPR